MLFVTNYVQLKQRIYLTKEALEGFGDFKIGGQIIYTEKYADDLVLLAKEEKVLQDMTDKVTEIGGSYGKEIHVEKTKVMKISRQPFPVKCMINLKQLENVESFKYKACPSESETDVGAPLFPAVELCDFPGRWQCMSGEIWYTLDGGSVLLTEAEAR